MGKIMTEFFGIGTMDDSYIEKLIDDAQEAGVEMDDCYEIFAELFNEEIIRESEVADLANLLIYSLYQGICYKIIDEINEYIDENELKEIEITSDIYTNCIDTHAGLIYNDDDSEIDYDIVDLFLYDSRNIEDIIEKDSILKNALDI